MKLRIPTLGLRKEGGIGIVNQKIIEIRMPHVKGWLEGKSRLFPWAGSGLRRRYPRPLQKK